MPGYEYPPARCMALRQPLGGKDPGSVDLEHRLITPGRLQVATHTVMRRVVTGFETRVARLTATVLSW